jgi:hypothetical protein
MANAIEEALKRADNHQEQAQTREALQSRDLSHSPSVDNTKAYDTRSNSAVANALNRASAQDRQIIDAAKPHILSVENTNQISPSNAPSQTQANSKGLEQKTLDPQNKANIESIQRGGGNNYLYPNAVDRAQSRPSQERQRPEPEPEKEH